VSPVADRFRSVQERVAAAAVRAGRDPAEIRICAVTKRSELPAIREAVAAGARILGENRVQEAAAKIEAAGDLGVEWHLIGHLQRNKARRAVALFQAVQSLDSLGLARRLADLGVERGRPVRVLVEVNTSGEAAKSGLEPGGAEEAIAAMRELAGIEVGGLMTMAPFTADPEPIRRCFRTLRSLRERAGGPAVLPELSMGMTNDFEVAVEEGSTLVRVGTAIFG
jgi:pyridoxal phosphate enzyme (YggS family)